jgi:hypothetical protein
MNVRTCLPVQKGCGRMGQVYLEPNGCHHLVKSHTQKKSKISEKNFSFKEILKMKKFPRLKFIIPNLFATSFHLFYGLCK